jgi:hypothetical protein
MPTLVDLCDLWCIAVKKPSQWAAAQVLFPINYFVLSITAAESKSTADD